MVKLYGESDSDFIEVRVLEVPVSWESQRVKIDYIPFSDKFVSTDFGSGRTIDLSIGCTSESERDNILEFIHDKLKRITFDDIKYMNAVYKGGNRNWPVTPITKLLRVPVSLQVSPFQYSFTLTQKMADSALPNSGNAVAIPEFVITGVANTESITISDGVRTLISKKTLVTSDILEISNWQALLNGEDVSSSIDGDYPEIPKKQTDFVLTVTGVDASYITVKYRETWR